MSILGYAQLQNEDRFAQAALDSIAGVVDDMVVVFDRCIDKTQDAVKTIAHTAATHVTSTEQELLDIRKTIFNEFKQFQWILAINGDEVYTSSIKDLPTFLHTKRLDDVFNISGHTIHVLNEAATLYTNSNCSRIAASTTKLYNNQAITSIKQFTPWALRNIEFTYGSRITFDYRQGTVPGACLTSYHMHFLKRSSVDFERPESPLSHTYHDGANDDIPLILPFL